MRAVLLIIIVAILALIAAVASGFLDINQIRGARAPAVSASGNGVTASGGQAPAFQVETGSIKVGSKDAQVKMPTVEVSRPGNEAATTAPVDNNSASR